MVDDRPVRKALRVAEVPQVVTMAPELVRDLGIADRRAVHVLVDSMVVLHQLLRKVPDVVQHLQDESVFTPRGYLVHSKSQRGASTAELGTSKFSRKQLSFAVRISSAPT